MEKKHGRAWKMFTHIWSFLFAHSWHAPENSVFHRQIALIRDSSICCHDSDYVCPKHMFLSYDLRCPPPRPLGACFQHNVWQCNITWGYFIKCDGKICAKREVCSQTDKTTRQTKIQVQMPANTEQFPVVIWRYQICHFCLKIV